MTKGGKYCVVKATREDYTGLIWGQLTKQVDGLCYTVAVKRATVYGSRQ